MGQMYKDVCYDDSYSFTFIYIGLQVLLNFTSVFQSIPHSYAYSRSGNQ